VAASELDPTGWNFADVWEAVARRFPSETALVHGQRRIDWHSFNQRANGIASHLLTQGHQHQTKVAQYQRNSNAFFESIFACFKARLVPVNTNYRYGEDELAQLWLGSDTEAVIFDSEFTEVCASVRSRAPAIRTWLRVGPIDGCPPWAYPYEDAASTVSTLNLEQEQGKRSGEDLYLLYTGGTTGLPKGVMWRQDDLFRMLEAQQGHGPIESADPEGFVASLDRRGPTTMPIAPLIHGTACWFTLPMLSRGGTVVTLPGASFDPVGVLDTVASEHVGGICIVGEAFARPLIRALEAHPDRWSFPDLRVVFSSGAILSPETKQKLLRHAARAIVVDGLGTSESGSLAKAVTTSDREKDRGFRPSETTRVIDEEGNDIQPGSDQIGRLAVGGHIPLGYYKDPAATEATFIYLEGKRYVVAGDLASVHADGTIRLVGRGSSCINTAGEKVYPEEVEEVIKLFPDVRDAAVIGVPDPGYGELVVALVEMEPQSNLDEAALGQHVRSKLAGYKTPKYTLAVTSLNRGPNGKLDHRHLRDLGIRLVSAQVLAGTPTQS
jgi:acyl-CoA synthetase (AMP-forming)/AMP-acid ligase II